MTDYEQLKREQRIRDLIRSETDRLIDFEYSCGGSVKIITRNIVVPSVFLVNEFKGTEKSGISALDEAIKYFETERKEQFTWEFQWHWPGSAIQVSWFSGKTYKEATDKFFFDKSMHSAIVMKTEIKPIS